MFWIGKSQNKNKQDFKNGQKKNFKRGRELTLTIKIWENEIKKKKFFFLVELESKIKKRISENREKRVRNLLPN